MISLQVQPSNHLTPLTEGTAPLMDFAVPKSPQQGGSHFLSMLHSQDSLSHNPPEAIGSSSERESRSQSDRPDPDRSDRLDQDHSGTSQANDSDGKKIQDAPVGSKKDSKKEQKTTESQSEPGDEKSAFSDRDKDRIERKQSTDSDDRKKSRSEAIVPELTTVHQLQKNSIKIEDLAAQFLKGSGGTGDNTDSNKKTGLQLTESNLQKGKIPTAEKFSAQQGKDIFEFRQEALSRDKGDDALFGKKIQGAYAKSDGMKETLELLEKEAGKQKGAGGEGKEKAGKEFAVSSDRWVVSKEKNQDATEPVRISSTKKEGDSLSEMVSREKESSSHHKSGHKRQDSESESKAANASEQNHRAGRDPMTGESTKIHLSQKFTSESVESAKQEQTERMERYRDIVQKAKVNLGSDGTSSASIRLKPYNLGNMTLELRMDGARLNANIILESESAKKMIHEELEHLKNELKSQGIQVESFSLRVKEPSSAMAFSQDKSNMDPSFFQASSKEGEGSGNKESSSGDGERTQKNKIHKNEAVEVTEIYDNQSIAIYAQKTGIDISV